MNDLILLQMPVDGALADPGDWARLDAACRSGLSCAEAAPLVAGVRRIAWSAKGGVGYAYLEPAGNASASSLAALVEMFTQHTGWAGEVRASRLEQVFDTPGASAGQRADFHYAVEMDPDDGWMPEIARWYDTEHMPGLAAVPGCIRASRFLNHGHGPLSLACYDLVTEDTLGSPPWLAVRATPWSDITRPHFTNTRRTMFRIAHQS
ncbi:hypothetical protein [Rhodoferax koreensis]|uniref:hypothetical protein n=1 Tax=Rhodoferax koreensis TaxID=1842727 RepID=UPI001EF72D30|nr:hypothetical protein [Rhodoferax koreense]